MSTNKEKLIAGVMVAAAGVSGSLLTPKQQINLLDFSQIPACTDPISLTGNYLMQERRDWQIIFGDKPTTVPCKIGPISAIRPQASKDSGKDPLTTVPTKVYLYMNDEDSNSSQNLKEIQK